MSPLLARSSPKSCLILNLALCVVAELSLHACCLLAFAVRAACGEEYEG